MSELVSAFIGLQGAGKSYELMRRVILRQLRIRKKGKDGSTVPPRRILTNIRGIDPDRIADYLGLDHVPVEYHPTAVFLDDRNYPTMEGGPGLLIRGGDIIVMDEAHNVWPETFRPTNNQAYPDRFTFLADARHFVDQWGRCCNVVYATHKFSGVAKYVRDRTGTVYKIRNRGRLGNIMGRDYKRHFRVEAVAYDEDMGLAKSPKLWTNTFKYDPAIWRLYKSVEVENDLADVEMQGAAGSTSIWHWKFFLTLALAVAALVFGFRWASSYFSGKCDAAPSSLMIEGSTVIANIGGKEVRDVQKIRRPNGDVVFVRSRCAWRIGSGGRLEPTSVK